VAAGVVSTVPGMPARCSVPAGDGRE